MQNSSTAHGLKLIPWSQFTKPWFGFCYVFFFQNRFEEFMSRKVCKVLFKHSSVEPRHHVTTLPRFHVTWHIISTPCLLIICLWPGRQSRLRKSTCRFVSRYVNIIGQRITGVSLRKHYFAKLRSSRVNRRKQLNNSFKELLSQLDWRACLVLHLLKHILIVKNTVCIVDLLQ